MGVGFTEMLLVFPIAIIALIVSVVLPIATFVMVLRINKKISAIEQRLRG